MYQEDGPPLGERLNRSMNLFMLVAGAFAFPAVVFLHRDIGRRFAGLQALLSFAILFFWPLLDPHYDPRPVAGFLAAVTFMCVVARVQGLRRKGSVGGDPVYRHYDGRPRLMGLLRCRDELMFKRLHEPVLVFFTGVLSIGASPLVGLFVITSAVGLLVSVNANAFASGERAESMRDRLHEQRYLVEQIRRGR